MDNLDGAERAMYAIANQFETMRHERRLAEKRIRALKAEMARRAIISRLLREKA